MFWKKTFRTLLLILFLLAYGCVSTSSLPFGNRQDEDFTITPPDRVTGKMADQPAHIKFVLAGMANKMRGNRDNIPEVKFSPDGKHAFYDTAFTYDDFDLHATEITGFEVKSQTDEQARMVIEGVFHFNDLFGRSSTNYFAADYTVFKDGITIHNSGTALIAPALPDIETYFVPKASFDGVDMTTMTSFMDLYLHAVLNGLQMEPTMEERKNKEAYDQLSTSNQEAPSDPIEPDDIFIMSFCKDRLPAESSLKMRVTDKPGRWSNTLFDPGYVYDQGWRVMIAGGGFCPNKLRTDVFINLEYNTNPELKNGSITIAEYTNQKNYADQPQYRVKIKSDSKASAAQPGAGPVESGALFLNPVKKEEAKLIQKRLSNLGYYKMAIDGDFGKGSQKALSAFKKENGLGDDNSWNLVTQKMLFKKSGL